MPHFSGDDMQNVGVGKGGGPHAIILSVWANCRETNAVYGSKLRQIGGETALFVFQVLRNLEKAKSLKWKGV